ncbi:hypothetical protein GGX14DRAFT_676348 [Mycena pura]|uniref:Uncharacterized protein n=1 Tax=Mycena pura TaxID=153505 RepID=A0AAD6YHW8_9AGAR|nr:hypothetical protein GGX14DRAFT_676348 [Mycena pura]
MLDARPLPPPSLLPLNVMPFPNINDPASTSALDVEDEYLNSAAKMADGVPVLWSLLSRPDGGASPQLATCLYNTGPTAAPAHASCKSRRVVPARKRTRRGSGLDRTARVRAACTVISRAAATRARVHAAPRGTTPSRGPRPRPQARLAAHAPGPAPPATAPERCVDAVQQRGLHALQPRARGTAHPDDPIHASVYAGAEELDVRPIHCFPDAPPFNIPESERKAARAPHRYRRGGTLWQQNTAATCARMQGMHVCTVTLREGVQQVARRSILQCRLE